MTSPVLSCQPNVTLSQVPSSILLVCIRYRHSFTGVLVPAIFGIDPRDGALSVWFHFLSGECCVRICETASRPA